MMNSNKRKRNVLTIEMKLKALERIDNGEPVSQICNELNVGKSTVSDWRRNRKSLQEFSKQIESEKVLSRRCTMKRPKNDVIDDALWIWFMQERQRGIPLNGPIVKEKAMQLHKKINNGEEFVASEGWLSRWKKRHGIHYLDVGDNIPDDKVLTDDQILEVVIQGEMAEVEEQEDSEAMNGDDDYKRISHSEGKKALETAMRYIEQQNNSSAIDIIFMNKWRDFASKQEPESNE